MLLEEAPHLVLEGILLGAYGIACHHAFIYIRGEFKRGYEIFCAALEQARAAGLRRQEHVRQRLRSRGHRPPRRGRVHLRRRDRIAQLARRQARRAASEAAVPGDRRPLRRADRRQQRRDARLSRADSRTGRGVVRGGRHRAQQGYKIVSVSGHVQQPRQLRNSARHDRARAHRDSRAACAPAARSWPCSPAAVRRRASSKNISICRTITRVWRRPARCSVRARSSSSTTRPISCKAAHNLVRFFAHESCGQCTPCREGGHWLERVSQRLVEGRGVAGDFEMLLRVVGSGSPA